MKGHSSIGAAALALWLRPAFVDQQRVNFAMDWGILVAGDRHAWHYQTRGEPVNFIQMVTLGKVRRLAPSRCDALAEWGLHRH